MVFRVELLVEAFPILAYGMVGVFAVTGVIIAVVVLLNQWASRK